MNVEITDKKVFVNGVEVLRLRRWFWKNGKRDVIEWKTLRYDMIKKEYRWHKEGNFDTWGIDKGIHPIPDRNWINEQNAKSKCWYTKSPEELNAEIKSMAILVYDIHPKAA